MNQELEEQVNSTHQEQEKLTALIQKNEELDQIIENKKF